MPHVIFVEQKCYQKFKKVSKYYDHSYGYFYVAKQWRPFIQLISNEER